MQILISLMGLILCLGLAVNVGAQADLSEESRESLNLLTAPLSPAFLLFGIEPAAVERPGTMTDMAISILNNTESLNAMPKDMAMEFAPYWLLGGSKITYEDFQSNRIGSNLLQTAALSIATTTRSETTADSGLTSLGFGLRISPWRGEIDREFDGYQKKLDKVYGRLKILLDKAMPVWKERVKNDAMAQAIRQRFLALDAALKDSLGPIYTDSLSQRENEIKEEVMDEIRKNCQPEIRSLKETIASINFHRVGWKLDFATGLVVDFPGRQVANGKVSRWGVWLTGGYEAAQLCALGVVRYIADENFSDVAGFDLGGRLIYDNHRKFDISAEGVYRKLKNIDGDRDRWRLAMVSDYAVAKNMTVSFTFGRDFEGNQSGNLLSMINLLMGFGSTRPVK